MRVQDWQSLLTVGEKVPPWEYVPRGGLSTWKKAPLVHDPVSVHDTAPAGTVNVPAGASVSSPVTLKNTLGGGTVDVVGGDVGGGLVGRVTGVVTRVVTGTKLVRDGTVVVACRRGFFGGSVVVVRGRVVVVVGAVVVVVVATGAAAGDGLGRRPWRPTVTPATTAMYAAQNHQNL